MANSIDVSVPETMMKKLQKFAKEELSKDEAGVLNAVFNVYNYAMEHRCTVFKDHPAFIKELNKLEEEVEASLVITPTITTITITTTIASHPIITCSAAARNCE
ncbi:MAG: hypothetical protein IPM51_16370 [Sphingobacteriaceae bacterium]|mgnify:CR=1 FL=1|jgi:hypothetical protein|nr:hypothetical protein [Sphingobacteriaceae bacterium]